MSNTIKLKKYSDVIEEYVAGGAITPGMLLKYDSNGEVIAQNAVNSIAMFALEDELQGGTIDDAYADGDPVQVWIPYRGDMVNALLSGANVVAGDLLQSASDGSLKKYAQTLAAATVDVLCLDAAGFSLTAKTAGSAGNGYSITIEEGAVTAGAETVVVTDKAIVVTIQAATSTIAQVVAALGAESDVTDVLTVAAIGTQSGVCGAVAETFLAGGEDAGAIQIVVIGQALAAATPNGSTIRCPIRVV